MKCENSRSRDFQQAMGVSEKKDKQKVVLFLDISISETVFSKPWSGQTDN